MRTEVMLAGEFATLSDLIRGHAEERPDKPAMIFEDRAIAYAELDAVIDRVAAALQRGLPVLGICYGAQLLALHHGGALYHDIATDLPRANSHQLNEADGRHAVTIEPGSRLAVLLGEAPGAVNSLHHQAIAEPGRGMRVSAHAPDGVPEALESEGPGFCLGVQWHPEKLEAPASDDFAIF